MAISTSSSLTAEVRQSYDKVMLHKAIPELQYNRFARKSRIPAGEGVVLNFRRSSLLAAATTPLTEGITPLGQTMVITNIPVTVAQYGNWVGFSDVVTVTAIDPILVENAENLGQNAGNTMDQLARTIAVAGTNVQYVNNRVSRVTVAAGDILADADVKKMRRNLANNNAKRIPGLNAFGSIVHPYGYYDLQGTLGFTNTGYYQDKEMIFSGEFTELYGVKFFESTNAQVFAAAGAAGIDVYATMVFGDEAFGAVDIAKLGLETIYHEPGSSGGVDPLNQRQTQAWKGTYAGIILNQSWMLRVEHAVSA